MLLTRNLNKRDLRQEETRKIYQEQQKKIQDQNKELEKQSKAIMAGMQAMLRDRLLQGYRHFMNQGYAEYEDRANMENIWIQYHALGANGVMDDMRMQFRRLPTQPGGPATPVDDD